MRLHALLLLMTLSLPVVAAPRERMDPERRAKVMDKIDAIRIARLTEALELDAAGAEKLFPVLRPFQERRRKAWGERFDALRGIDDTLETEKPDEKELGKQLDALMASNVEIAKIAEDEYKALKPVLAPVQLARYYRFQSEFERKIGEIIRDVKGGGDGQGMGGRGGKDKDKLRHR